MPADKAIDARVELPRYRLSRWAKRMIGGTGPKNYPSYSTSTIAGTGTSTSEDIGDAPAPAGGCAPPDCSRHLPATNEGRKRIGEFIVADIHEDTLSGLPEDGAHCMETGSIDTGVAQAPFAASKRAEFAPQAFPQVSIR